MSLIRSLARVFILVVSFSLLQSLPARAGVTAPSACVSGSISSNTTWTLAMSPVDICTAGVSINSGVTLTVDPGVTVQFDNSGSNKLTVLGTLVAKGTPAAPITFTGVTASPGSWGGINAIGVFGSPATVNLDNVVINYGGTAGPFGAAIYADQLNLTIAHSQVENSAGNGLYTTQNTKFDIQSTSFTANAQNALQLNSTSQDILLSGLTATGNGLNAVRLAGTTVLHGQRSIGNPGIPYIVDSVVSNTTGDVLTIDPGNSFSFTGAGFLGIGGSLVAPGTSAEPILMTGTVQSPGSWRGIQEFGGSIHASVQLDYVTIEYGGNDINGANIEVSDGLLNVHHSIIRNSSKDGVKFDASSGGSILDSQIYGNGLYGVRNASTNGAILATNDWWGDAGGPKSDVAACSSGNGDKVTSGVLFVPIFTSANASTQGAFPLTNAPSITLTPRRWFAPADNLTRVYFDITLTDGNGAPIPGRTVRLNSSLGTVVDGGITDANGHTLAYITSGTTGDANVVANLDALTACEAALSPDSKVTFTTPVNVTELLPNAPASYLDGDLTVTPLPVNVGVNTTVSAKFTNPLSTPVTMDVEFGFAQAGIGLVFGPIKNYTGQVIPGNSSITLSASFVPSVAGHYCVQVTYNITKVGIISAVGPLAGGSGSKQRNLNVYHAPTASPDQRQIMDKTRNSLRAVNMFVDRTYTPNPFAVPLYVANQGINWDLKNAEKISAALNGDPPRQDYTFIDVPKVLPTPHIQAGGGLQFERANAMNDLIDALDQANSYGTAAAIAFDRSAGATEAGDLQWSSTQTGVMLEYEKQFGTWVITAAQKIDALLTVAANEGTTSVPVTVSDVIAMQQKLAASGFSTQEIADAHAAGLTDADLTAFLQDIIAANPQDLAGDVIAKMQQVSASFYLLGNVLTNPTFFAPGLTVGGTAGIIKPAAAGNTLAQPYNMTTTIQVGNPLATTQVIDVSVRRISLPADWTVTVSPSQVSLASGATATVTVTILTGSPVLQGSHPEAAIEGYAGSQLLGGVVIDLGVPLYAPFDGKLRMYLPEIRK